MSLLAVIGVVLVILKLCGLIAISWVYVTLPFWIMPVIWLFLIFMGACVAVIASYDRPRFRR